MSLIGKITFTNNPNDIFSGESINLFIEIENSENVFIKEIFLHFFGEINCQWDELINQNKEGEILYVMEVFKDRQILVDKHLSILNMDVVNQGKYVYNAVLNVPQELPESVTRKYGSVRYELKLGICSTKGSQILYKMPLNVKRYLNICLDEDYMVPFHTVFKKFFCWGVCQTAPIKIILTVPVACALPGDCLNYFIKIENFGKLLDVQQISILLTQTQHYKVLKPVKRIKHVHTTLKQIKFDFVQNHHNSKLHGLFLLPKNLVPSSPTDCLLNTSYHLRFFIVFTGFQTDGFVSVPLKIGSHRNNLAKIGHLTKKETKLEIYGDGKTTECEV